MLTGTFMYSVRRAENPKVKRTTMRPRESEKHEECARYIRPPKVRELSISCALRCK